MRSRSASEGQEPTLPSPDYWLGICQGMDAAEAFIQASDAQICGLLDTYPILLLPGFPQALKVLNRGRDGSRHEDAHQRLQDLQDSLRQQDAIAYGQRLHLCAICLAQDIGGDRRINLVRAAQLCRDARHLLPTVTEDAGGCLMDEGNIVAELAALGVDSRSNLRLALKLYANAYQLLWNDQYRGAACIFNQGAAHEQLAGLSRIVCKRLEKAVQCYSTAWRLFDSCGNDANAAVCLFREAATRVQLAMARCNPSANLQSAGHLYRNARRALPSNDQFVIECLIGEGRARVQLAKMHIDPRENLDGAMLCFRDARGVLSVDRLTVAVCLREEGAIHLRLAALNIDREDNLMMATRCLDEAHRSFPPDSLDVAMCWLDQGIAQIRLAQLGKDSRNNAEQAIQCCIQARRSFPPDNVNIERCFRYEGDGHALLAEMNVDTLAHTEQAAACYKEARGALPVESLLVAQCWMREGQLRVKLAQMNSDPRDNAEQAIHCCMQARHSLPTTDHAVSTCLNVEASARIKLADLQVDPDNNLVTAIDLFTQARDRLPTDHPSAARFWLNEGLAHTRLANLGHLPQAELKEAIRCYNRARQVCVADSVDSVDSVDSAICLRESGRVYRRLANMGLDPRSNLERALHHYTEARRLLPSNSHDAARCLMDEGHVYLRLAELHIDERVHLEQAVKCCKEARRIVSANSRDAVTCLVNEAVARILLADRSVDARQNYEQAVEYCAEAFRLSPQGSHVSATCLMEQGNARLSLARLGVEPGMNLARSEQCFKQAQPLFSPNSIAAARCLMNTRNVHTLRYQSGIGSRVDVERAWYLYDAAGVHARRIGAHLVALEAFNNHGALALGVGAWDVAQRAFDQGIQELELVQSTAAMVQNLYEWIERSAAIFKGMVRACLHMGHYDEALTHIERGRSRVLADLLAQADRVPQHISSAEQIEYLRLRRREEELRGQLDSSQRSLSTIDDDNRPPRTVASEQERMNVVRRMEDLEHSDHDYLSVDRYLSLDEMRALASRLGRTLGVLWVGRDGGIVYFITPAGSIDWLRLSVTDDVVQTWMGDTLGEQGPTGWMGTYLTYTSRKTWMAQIDLTLSQIYLGIMQPIHEWLLAHGESRIVLVVGGQLGLLPLHAASWKDGDEVRYLVDHVEITYAPSAWVLHRCVRHRKGQWSPVLGVADPQCDNPQVPALPFSAWEVSRLAEIVTETKGDHRSTTRLLGDNATFDQIAPALASHAVAHFGCHSTWDFRQPLQSALLLSANDQLTLGHLLASTQLDHIRLVVLSSCNSVNGYRPESMGEEYLGLPAGFLVAGAEAVVGTFWRVLDLPTALFMVHMYEVLFTGVALAAALREAQVWLRDLTKTAVVAYMEQATPMLVSVMTETELEQHQARYRAWLAQQPGRPFSHPYYWAAFSVLGYPGPLVSQ